MDLLGPLSCTFCPVCEAPQVYSETMFPTISDSGASHTCSLMNCLSARFKYRLLLHSCVVDHLGSCSIVEIHLLLNRFGEWRMSPSSLQYGGVTQRDTPDAALCPQVYFLPSGF